MDANLLKQLENSLISYQENQETLDVVVQTAQKILGDDWMQTLPTAFDQSDTDENIKVVLRDKASHAINYYSALLAWQEAYSYLNNPQTITVEYLQERIPTLEYWLNLFGQEGLNLMQKVKELYTKKANGEVFEMTDSTPEVEETQPVAEVEESQQPVVEEQPAEQVIEPTEEQPASEVEQNEITPVEQEQTEVAADDVVTETATDYSEPQGNDKTLIEKIMHSDEAIEGEKTEDEVVEESDVIETNPLAQEWEDKNTAGEVPLEDWIDLDSIPTATVPVSDETVETPINDPQMVSQNWDIAAFLKQKELVDGANNWLSAWCVRMDNAEKTSYPHYGFIVDLMHDLKEKAQLVLDNQLLEDLVEQDVPGGRAGIKRLVDSIDKEIENLPDDFKTSTAEKIRLNAREILGKIDTSTEREEIEKAPDGFELMDDPYETSAQQIIDDFEKTEKEAQNKIDQLNVMEDNND